MTKIAESSDALPGSIVRLAGLAQLQEAEIAALAGAAREWRRIGASREVIREGEPVEQTPSILLSGWACRVRDFSDGRRQILGFLLPGDLIGQCQQPRPVAATTVVAGAEVQLCTAPRADAGTPLAQAYAVSAALEEFYLFRQIARLGRLNAYERIVDWLLEMRDRLAAALLTQGAYFPVPMTQEMLADALGLTSVHVNRTLQTLRREGVLELRGGLARLHDPEALGDLVGYRPAVVSLR